MRRLAAGLLLGAVLGSGAAADGVLAFCAAEGAGAEACACAARRLAGEYGIDEYAQHHRVGWDYALLRDRGAGPDRAWESAMAAEIARSDDPAETVRHRAEAMARAHRAFIRICRMHP